MRADLNAEVSPICFPVKIEIRIADHILWMNLHGIDSL
jgi:hypothetical protein